MTDETVPADVPVESPVVADALPSRLATRKAQHEAELTQLKQQIQDGQQQLAALAQRMVFLSGAVAEINDQMAAGG